MPENKPVFPKPDLSPLQGKLADGEIILKLTGQLAVTEQRLRDLVEAESLVGHGEYDPQPCDLCKAFAAARELLEGEEK